MGEIEIDRNQKCVNTVVVDDVEVAASLAKLFRNNEWIENETFSKSRISFFIVVKSNS